MGSFLVRTFLINYPEAELAGVLLSGTGQHPGPMIQAGLAAVAHEKKKLGNHGRSKKVYDLCFGIYNRKFKSARTPSDWTTRDEAMVDAHMKDPLGNFIPTLELFDEMLNGIKYIGKKENIAKVNKKLPILLFSGDKDPVGDSGRGVKKVYRAYVSAGVQDVSIKLYPGGRHEMLNEINRSEVYDYISDWIFSKM